MSLFNRKKLNTPEDAQGLQDPLTGRQMAPETPPKPEKPKKQKMSRIVRIRNMEQDIVRSKEEDIDPGNVVSMYMPRRRIHKIGALLWRLDKLSLALLLGVLLIAILFIAAFMQEKAGNFTINLNRLELYRKGIAIAADRDFTDPTARLSASTVENATNTTLSFLPEDLDDIDGDHNGADYVAYTYYLRNGGKVDVGYRAQLVLNNASKGAEYAARVMVWHNGESTVYAEPSADGTPEDGCVNFESHDVVCTIEVPEFLVGYVDKYTVVIWLEGEDPECVDAIVGGNLQFNMNIESISEEEDTPLVSKFIQDIRAAITGQDPIEASGTDAPEYYLNNKITWNNRRNQ